MSAHGDEHAAALPSGLSKPAQRALAQAGYTRLGQLSAVSASELLQLHGMGPKAIAVLESALAEAGLSLRRDGTATPSAARRRVPGQPGRLRTTGPSALAAGGGGCYTWTCQGNDDRRFRYVDLTSCAWA